MEKFTLMQCLNSTDVSHLSPPELLPCFDAIKSNYTLLDDSSKTFDSYSLLNYEKNLFSKLEDMYSKLYASKIIKHVPLKYKVSSNRNVLHNPSLFLHTLLANITVTCLFIKMASSVNLTSGIGTSIGKT